MISFLKTCLKDFFSALFFAFSVHHTFLISKMLCKLEETFLKAVNFTEIEGNKMTSIFDYNSLTDASFNIFLTAIPEKKLPILPSFGKRNFKNTSKCEILICEILSKYHRMICKSVPYR